MKTYLFPLVPVMAVAALLSAPAIAAPESLPSAPIFTNTDHPNLAPIEGTAGQTDGELPNEASPTGTVKNMAPTRGKPLNHELKGINPSESASGLTIPGASSGSSLGSGSNSTLPTVPKAEQNEPLPD